MPTALELTTRTEVWRAFVASSSPRVIAVSLVGASAARAFFGGPSWLDVGAVVAVAALLGPVEWIVHRRLLHARPGDRLGELLGTRDSHERHHRDPGDLVWLLLRRPNAIGSCAAIVVPMAMIAAVVDRWVVDDAPSIVWGTATTAMTAGLLALLHYEWVHLLVHSRYRPTSRYYARLDRNHRLHHYRNERYWLGVTVDIGDRLARTLPSDRDAVPASRSVRGAVAPD